MHHSHDGGGGSLQSSLIAAARRWEQERSQEGAALRRQAAEANQRAAAEGAKLRQQTLKVTELEAKLKDESAKLKDANFKLKEEAAEKTRFRLQAIGSFLILAELRCRLKALAPTPMGSGLALEQRSPDEALAPPFSEGTSNADDDDDDDGDDADGDADEGTGTGTPEEEAARKKRLAKKKKAARQKKKKKGEADEADGADGGAAAAAAAREEDDEAGGEDGAAEGKEVDGKEADGDKTATASGVVATTPKGGEARAQLVVVATAWDAVLEVLEPLPSMVRSDELLEACKDGRSRAVESFFSQYSLCDAVEERAQDLLVQSLEECALHGRGQLVKTLIDGGADAHRTSALHISIRHGHVSILNHLVTTVMMSVNSLDDEGSSPLHVAASANQPKAAQFLLKQCASIDARDGQGRTALEIATAMRWKEMQRVLQVRAAAGGLLDRGTRVACAALRTLHAHEPTSHHHHRCRHHTTAEMQLRKAALLADKAR